MRLEGSCHCGAVAFEMETDLIYPLFTCYCGRCRKVNGSPASPYVTGRKSDLRILKGAAAMKIYNVDTNERSFCGLCGSSLFYMDSRWPEECWPLASAIDTPLPTPERFVHIFVGSKAPWFPICAEGPQFDDYADLTARELHERWGLI